MSPRSWCYILGPSMDCGSVRGSCMPCFADGYRRSWAVIERWCGYGALRCWRGEAGLAPTCSMPRLHLSLSRLNHRLPGREAHPEGVQGTAKFHHQIADALLPQADPVFDDATALDTAVDMLDP